MCFLPYKEALVPHREALLPHKEALVSHREGPVPNREALGPHREALVPHKEELVLQREALVPHKEALVFSHSLHQNCASQKMLCLAIQQPDGNTFRHPAMQRGHHCTCTSRFPADHTCNTFIKKAKK